jgi:ATP-binding cassette subfamily F protein 3
MDQIDYAGIMKLGHNVKIGYFAQNQASLLDENKTVFETIDYVAVGDIRTRIRDILGAFMFGGEASDKKVKVLSGGERSRLAMIRLLLEPVNLLILDEPTNHLDMQSKDVLKEAIKAFDGTVILVSHDREFLNGLVTKVYEFGNKKVREHLGGIYEFLQYKKMDSLKELEVSTSLKIATDTPEKAVSENKMSYEARKEHARNVRKAERAVEEIEKAVTSLEEEIVGIEKLLELPQNASDTKFILSYQKKQRDLEQKVYEWELLSEELVAIKAVNAD